MCAPFPTMVPCPCVTRALEQARNAFQTAKSYADAFHESNATVSTESATDKRTGAETEPADSEKATGRGRTARFCRDRQSGKEEGVLECLSDSSFFNRLSDLKDLSTSSYMIWLFSGTWIQNLFPDGCPHGFVCSRLELLLLQDLVLADDEYLHSRNGTTHSLRLHHVDVSLVHLSQSAGWNLQLFHANTPKPGMVLCYSRQLIV